jgi:hypothetical protein
MFLLNSLQGISKSRILGLVLVHTPKISIQEAMLFCYLAKKSTPAIWVLQMRISLKNFLHEKLRIWKI